MSLKKKIKADTVKYNILCLLTVLIICTVATVFSILLHKAGISRVNLLMFMLVGVLITTVITRGYIYGILTSVISIFSFNYFFTEPYHTFAITDRQDLLLLLFFSIAAIISGLMSSNAQQQKMRARDNAHNSQLMYEVTESFFNLTGVDNIIHHTLKYLYDTTGSSCMVKLDNTRNLPENIRSIYFTDDIDNVTQKSANMFIGNSYTINGVKSKLGTVVFENNIPFDTETDRLIRTIVNQTGLSLDREYIYYERERILLAMESEHFKTTLLRSISHDIRTPLTEISGAGNVILENIDTLSRDELAKLISDINTEADWLVMTVQNILNMTRLSEGKMSLALEYEAADDLITQAASRLPASYDRSRLKITMPEQIMLVKVDGNLFVQMLVNLLDNAYKHSGEHSMINFGCRYLSGNAVFTVADNGCGISSNIIDHIFEGFTTQPASASDKGRGVGLGLSICQAIVKAHGGRITAANAPEGGAVFTVTMPCDLAGQ